MTSNGSTRPVTNRPQWVRRLWRWALVALALVLVAFTVVLLDIVGTWVGHRPLVVALADSVPGRTAYMDLRISEGSTPRHRQWVALDSLPTAVVCAVVNAEDPNFFDAGAVDWWAQRQVLRRMMHGDFSRGSSGISQQLARNLFLGPARTPRRKMREYALAFQLDRSLSKTRQLELYLNLVEWGEGVWGIAAGSEQLFGRAPGQLTPMEAVLLPMVLPAPSRGLAFPLGARQRRARAEGLAKLLWRQAIFDDLTATATAARARRLGEHIEAGMAPVEAARAVGHEMGPESPADPREGSGTWADRCNPNRRAVF